MFSCIIISKSFYKFLILQQFFCVNTNMPYLLNEYATEWTNIFILIHTYIHSYKATHIQVYCYSQVISLYTHIHINMEQCKKEVYGTLKLGGYLYIKAHRLVTHNGKSFLYIFTVTKQPGDGLLHYSGNDGLL